MVNDLLDLAKVEAGRVDISPAWFEMVDLFSALRGMFRPVLTNPDVTLVFEEPRDSFRLYTDHKKLSQILRNFISNALKFTLKGEVRVMAQTNDDDTLTFSVKDDGIGIAKEFHAVIFDDFTQVDSPVQKRLRGTGLGLSLSSRLAESCWEAMCRWTARSDGARRSASRSPCSCPRPKAWPVRRRPVPWAPTRLPAEAS